MISGVILAGGISRRMGGQDKGLACFAGLPLIQHVISRIAPQVDDLHINTNQHWDDYQRLGYPLIADDNADFQGPLAGVLAGLKMSKHEWVLTAPCDTPFLPENLVARLLAASDGMDVVVASTTRIHATVMLCQRSLAANLTTALAQGLRKVQDWQAGQRCRIVKFGDESAFVNINTPEQLANAQRQ
ncbi:MAG: molybdenum cofactor guanylyltransferase MobA [Sulfuriferula sp.]